MTTRQSAEVDGPPKGSNLLINGGFRIWQRGTSFTDTASGVYTADMWKETGDNATGTVERVTDSKYGQYAMRLNDTDSSNKLVFTNRAYKGESVGDLIQGVDAVATSAWIKEGPNGQHPSGYKFRLVSPGVEILHSVNIDSIGSEWSRVTLAFAGDLQDPSNQIGVDLVPQNNETGDYIIDGFTLTVGPDPVNYPAVVRPIGQEQSLAERYYERIDINSFSKIISRDSNGNCRFRLHNNFSQKKSAVPTVMTPSPTNITLNSIPSQGDGSNTDDQSNWSTNSTGATANDFAVVASRSSTTTLDTVYGNMGTIEAEVT